jgi:hypothetical protein
MSFTAIWVGVVEAPSDPIVATAALPVESIPVACCQIPLSWISVAFERM